MRTRGSKTQGMKMPEKKDWTKEELKREYIDTMTAITIPVNISIEGQQRIFGIAEAKKILKQARARAERES